jgi:hypothetical protein
VFPHMVGQPLQTLAVEGQIKIVLVLLIHGCLPMPVL